MFLSLWLPSFPSMCRQQTDRVALALSLALHFHSRYHALCRGMYGREIYPHHEGKSLHWGCSFTPWFPGNRENRFGTLWRSSRHTLTAHFFWLMEIGWLIFHCSKKFEETCIVTSPFAVEGPTRWHPVKVCCCWWLPCLFRFKPNFAFSFFLGYYFEFILMQFYFLPHCIIYVIILSGLGLHAMTCCAFCQKGMVWFSLSLGGGWLIWVMGFMISQTTISFVCVLSPWSKAHSSLLCFLDLLVIIKNEKK